MDSGDGSYNHDSSGLCPVEQGEFAFANNLVSAPDQYSMQRGLKVASQLIETHWNDWTVIEKSLPEYGAKSGVSMDMARQHNFYSMLCTERLHLIGFRSYDSGDSNVVLRKYGT